MATEIWKDLYRENNTNPCKFWNFCPYIFPLCLKRAQIICYEKKGNLNFVMLKGIFYARVKFRNFKGFVWITTQMLVGGRSPFWRPSQSLLLRYTAKNFQVT